MRSSSCSKAPTGRRAAHNRVPGVRRLRAPRPASGPSRAARPTPGPTPQTPRARRRRHLQLRLRRSDDPNPRPRPRRRRRDGLPRQHADLPDPVEPRAAARASPKSLYPSGATTPESCPTTPTRAPGSRASPSSAGLKRPTSSTRPRIRPASARRRPSAAPPASSASTSSASVPGTRTRPATARLMKSVANEAPTRFCSPA